MRLLVATLVAFFCFPWSGYRACEGCAPVDLPALRWTVAEDAPAPPSDGARASVPPPAGGEGADGLRRRMPQRSESPASVFAPASSAPSDAAAAAVRAVQSFEEGLPPAEVSIARICEALIDAAAAHDLPPTFFIRLIWRESRFDAYAVSPAGAQGIAQFMPRVAAEFGLLNPFDPAEALPHSARLLRTLLRQFGNLGLAAAAYNAGARRIQDWLAKRGALPKETRAYVLGITGFAAERWRDAGQLEEARVDVPARVPCQHAAVAMHVPAPEPPPAVPAAGKTVAADAKPGKAAEAEKAKEDGAGGRKPPLSDTSAAAEKRWLVQLAAEKSREGALERFQRLKRHARELSRRAAEIVETAAGARGKRAARARLRTKAGAQVRAQVRAQVAFSSRAAAQQVCDRLKKAGASCEVVAD